MNEVLCVIYRYPPHTGGVTTHVREIEMPLADDGHNVIIFSIDAALTCRRRVAATVFVDE